MTYQLSLFGDDDTAVLAPVPAAVSVKETLVEAITEIFEEQAPKENFFYLKNEFLPTGEGAKIKANLAAIRLVKEAQGRELTDAEKQQIAAYTGWGGLSSVFSGQKPQALRELGSLLSEAELAAAQESVLTAYYTEPDVAKAMWDMVAACGFTHGRIMEPSAGVGHFIGSMPEAIREKSRVVAVEIDSISSQLLRAAYGGNSTHVIHGGIEAQNFEGSFDLVVGNVPFGNYRVHDPELDHLKLPIHEYFVAKALKMVRAGGLVALIVTASMLDKKHSRAVDYMLRWAKPLRCVRLPSGAFNRLGGTDVVADIIVLQKRDQPLDPECSLESVECGDFVQTSRFAPQTLEANSHFVKHPEWVLGKMEVAYGRFGQRVGVVASDDWMERLNQVSQGMPLAFDPGRNVGEQGHGYRAKASIDVSSAWSPGFFFDEDGVLMEVDERAKVQSLDSLPAATLKRLQGMTRIRDCALRLLEADAANSGSAQSIRAELGALYDRFVKQSGYLLAPVNRRLFRRDTHAPLLWSLEIWNDEDEKADKADLFSHSTVAPASLASTADTLDDGIALSYNRLGRLDVGFVAKAMGKAASRVVEELVDSERGYIDPVTGQCVDSIEYLSGDVRQKHLHAKEASKTSEQFLANVHALEKVLPQWLPLSEIETRLGVPWVSAEVIEKWLKQTFGIGEHRTTFGYATVSVDSKGGSWSIKFNWPKHELFRTEWGTQRKNFWDILQNLLNQQTPEVFDTVDTEDGKTRRVINRDETLACQEKAEMIGTRFVQWISENADVAHDIEQQYNMRFNSYVNRSYDGSHLVIPGLNPKIELRAAQKDAIWRGIVSGNTLHAIAVGGGKTLIQICTAQECKRLGLAAKPILVVPNHMLEAFAGEYLRAYPRAKVLAMSKDDMQGERRKTILMRAATNDWDCVIVTHSVFGRIAIKEETINEYIEEVKAEVTAAVMGTSNDNLVREAMRSAKQVEARLKSLADKDSDKGILGFEEIGIDMILVDEADLFKNLFFFTKKKRIPGISSSFSSRALDLFIKSRIVFKKRGSTDSGLVFATATPISNSIGEMFVMQKYLQEGALKRLEIDSFDSWSASFAREVTCVEVKPEGSGYRMHTRFAQFVNVPELMRVFREVAEIRTKAMLKLPEPELKGRGHTIVAVAPSEAQKAYVQSLAERAEEIREGKVEPSEDNMLCVTGDGRKAALDMRCIDPQLPNDPTSKVNVCANQVFEIWKATEQQRATQLVFCDLSVPGTAGFSVYEHIREVLLEKGVPAEEVAFAQEWDTDMKKAKLHRLVRGGKIRVLIGSTELMGFGTNVQDRLIAKHDLDAPWRPRDVEQRDGRIIRQGNMHGEVEIFRYVTESTFDAYMWETLERKARFIAQVMGAENVARKVEDVTSQALSFAEVKALASGNPIVLEKASIDAEVAKLEAVYRVHKDDMRSLASKQSYLRDECQFIKKGLAARKLFLDKAQIKGHPVEVMGQTFSSYEKAAETLYRVKRSISDNLGEQALSKQTFSLATVGNVRLAIEFLPGKAKQYGEYAQIDGVDARIKVKLPYYKAELAAYLEAGVMVEQVNEQIENLHAGLARCESEMLQIQKKIEAPFEHMARLQDALARQAEINISLEIDSDDKSALALSDD